MGEYVYKTKGTCARSIKVELDGEKIKKVEFEGGCPGNTAAIAKIVEGMDADFVIGKFKGNLCGNRLTSCADQLAIAIELAREAAGA